MNDFLIFFLIMWAKGWIICLLILLPRGQKNPGAKLLCAFFCSCNFCKVGLEAKTHKYSVNILIRKGVSFNGSTTSKMCS